MKACFNLLLGMLLAASASQAGKKLCGTRPDAMHLENSPFDIGGKHITARGTLRVLIVFASFPDDEAPHAYWPAHSPPQFMQQFIDPDTATRSQSVFNVTNYFRQMSLGKFNLIGEAIWVETNHSQEEYRNGAYGRANQNVLQERVDSLVDFSFYDHWRKSADYAHENVADGIVDMIVMVWRTTMFEYLGEASLGYRAGFVLDGKRIEMGYPEYLPMPLGSGITCMYPYADTPNKVMQTMVHELSHWLLGGAHPYNGTTEYGKHAYWGMLCNGQRVASCANSYDRERLGWIDVPEVPPDTNVLLADFVQTGAAYKFHPPNGQPFEYFYIENHQQLSVFDDVTANPADKGIWILHQEGEYLELDNLRIRPSDGCWHWENPFSTSQCFSQSLPVFRRGVPRSAAGESHRDQIPNSTSAVNWLFAYANPLNQVHCGAFFTGYMFNGAFTPDAAAVFSSYSNPASTTFAQQPTPFSLKILAETNGVMTIRYATNPLEGAPARRYLGFDPATQGIESDTLFLAWGDQWAEGQPLESDVNAAELQRRIGNEQSWTTVYFGSAMRWRDTSQRYDSAGTIPVQFRVSVVDAQGNRSVWSDIFTTRSLGTNSIRDPHLTDAGLPTRFALGQNYPNPFNPTTLVAFRIANFGLVSLKLFDMLGKEVATLVNEELEAGTYETRFDGSNLSSGVYVYRLVSGDFSATRKLVVMK